MKCHGVINKIKNCKNEIEYQVIGYTAQFGVSSTNYVCKDCMLLMKKSFTPKILAYNNFSLEIYNIKEKIKELQEKINVVVEKMSKITITEISTSIIYSRNMITEIKELKEMLKFGK